MPVRMPTPPSPAASAVVVTMLYLSYMLAFADRVIVAVALDSIGLALDLSDTQLGIAAGGAFAISYAVFSPAAGMLVDRGSARWVLSGAIAVWSAATAMTGLATSFGALLISRVVVAMGEAAVQPVAVSLLSRGGRVSGRPLTFGVYLSAGALGALVALVGGGLFLSRVGALQASGAVTPWGLEPWRLLFVAAALVGLAMVVPVFWFLRQPPVDRGDAATVVAPRREVWAHMRRNRRLMLAVIGGMTLMQLGPITLGTWAVAVFERSYGWTSGEAALRFGLTSGMALFVGCFLGGAMLQMMQRRGVRAAPLRLSLASGVVFAMLAVAALLAPDAGLALGLLCGAFIFGYVPLVCTFTAIAEITPPSLRARMTGLNIMVDGLVFSALGPLMVGLFSDLLFPGPTGIVWALVVALGVSTTLGAVLLIQGFGSYASHRTDHATTSA